MNDRGQLVSSFELGVHTIEIRQHVDRALSLWLDGCERKRRGSGGGAAWLWTNVELPFEDHHLVEIRRGADDGAPLDVRVNGEQVASGTPPQR